MQVHFGAFDWLVLVLYFAGIIGLGLAFRKRSNSSEEFTAGGRSLPGWLCGLSIFATYLSSISYLALPGKSFVGNWNPFVFSLALPIAGAIAVRFFLPMYRSTGEVSAYALLEKRFGPWARIYSSAFYLLFQVARIGVVMYLMALPMAVIFGWPIRPIILVTGVVVTLYAYVGGIVAVIWADAIQAIVLLVGALIALGVLMSGMPEGPEQIMEIASENDKFSLGSYGLSVSESTVWVVLAYGLFENLKNFGIDQSYIQRYIAAKSDRDAKRSIWIGAILYIPVSALFFFIGTALFAFYQTHPADQTEVRRVVAKQKLMQDGIDPQYVSDASGNVVYSESFDAKLTERAAKLEPKEVGDRVFPHFIAAHLPTGLTGLLIAAVFAAAMSTVSTSLNSSATLVMSDFYQRFVSPDANDKSLMRVLHGATAVWGILGTAMALVLVRLTESALDVWWTLSSVLGSGIVGLFLLGVVNRRAGNRAALVSVVIGSLVILWMILSASDLWPEELQNLKSPFHSVLVIVVGTLSIVGVGSLVSLFVPRREPSQPGDASSEG